MFNVSYTPNVLYALKRCEIGNRVPLKNFRNNYVIGNICKNNYSETILKGHTREIVALDVQGSFLATASGDHTIKLWNLDTEKCLWTFHPDPQVTNWYANLKIVEENIICSGASSGDLRFPDTIQIIDLNTGQKTTSIRAITEIKDSRLVPAGMYMIGRQIFAILEKENEEYVVKWDINGVCQQIFSKIKHNGTPRQRLLLGSENFLVHIYYNILKIHDLQSGKDRTIKLVESGYNGKDIKVEIASAYIKDQRLICGCRDYGVHNCYAIDLKIKEGNSSKIDKFSSLINFLWGREVVVDGGRVEKIILHREWAYLGHSNGHLVAIDLEKKKIIPLGRHRSWITYLALEEQLLISGSSFPKVCLKFWNIKSLEQVQEIVFPDYSLDMAFVSGKLLVAIGNSLKTWNYFIPSIKKDIKKNCENLARK